MSLMVSSQLREGCSRCWSTSPFGSGACPPYNVSQGKQSAERRLQVLKNQPTWIWRLPAVHPGVLLCARPHEGGPWPLPLLPERSCIKAGSCLSLWVVHVCEQRLQQLHCCIPLGIHDFLHLLGADIQVILLHI